MAIAENLHAIEQGIIQACEKSGRSREQVQLVAVSKTKPLELIQEAFAAKQLHFGENKVQELVEKQPQLPEQVQWHLIGHLQSNKISKALPCCDLLHTLDSVKLAKSVDRISAELNKKTSCLLQVNISDDPAKYGFTEADTSAAIQTILELPNIELTGLMTIPEYNPDPEATRVHFCKLRELRDQLTDSFAIMLPELSMGMSHDYQVAIEEGATLVRVGSSIFGSRG